MVFRKFALWLFACIVISSCTKNQHQTACGTQICTQEFRTISIYFIDKQGKPIAVSDFSVFNLSANKQTYPGIANWNMAIGYYTIANDSQLNELSTDGDNLRIMATNAITGQTKSAIVKVAGGCNCHVTKISGPDQIQFD